MNELSGQEEGPLAFRMMESMPGFIESAFFAQRRGVNTIMRGGFMDDRLIGRSSFNIGGVTRKNRLANYANRFGVFQKGSMTPTSVSKRAFYGSSGRRAGMVSNAGTANGKMAFGKPARINHLSARPRIFNRYSSVTMFNASENTPYYSPFQFLSNVVGKVAIKNDTLRTMAYGAGTKVSDIEGPVLQRGMMSMFGAMNKMNKLETKVARGGMFAGRAEKKLARAQTQALRIATMNNPAAVANITQGSLMAQAKAGKVGATGNIMAIGAATPLSQGILGYSQAVMGAGSVGLTGTAAKFYGVARKQFAGALLETGLASTKREAILKTGQALTNGITKTLGKGAVGKLMGTKGGAAVLGARGALMALPVINVLATASLVYDLGKMGGELVKSGVNLAKDAVKSMRGSINKPMFGMGYKDNEIAATSRSRGVMAIQNSRLNARSMLGSEAGMMAAHFG